MESEFHPGIKSKKAIKEMRCKMRLEFGEDLKSVS